MATEPKGRRNEKNRNARSALDPLAADGNPSTSSKLEIVQNAFLAPFQHKKRDSTKILSDSTVASRPRASVGGSGLGKPRLDFATLGRAPLRMSFGSRRITSRDLQIVEATEELLDAEVPDADDFTSNVSLLRGFNATIPSADQGRTRRRQMRNVETPRIGLKKLGMSARGLMTEENDHDGQSIASEDDVVVINAADAGKKGKKRSRESLSTQKVLGKEELSRQTQEIQRDKENLHVRRSLINSEIAEITNKIEALDSIRTKLEQDLLKLQEDELELDDELLADVKDLHSFPLNTTSFRQTLESHTTPITALDFSEPYGTLVSASQEDAQPRVWDLFSGSEIGRLRGHSGAVKCIQVEDHVCLTGGEDGNVRLWDLRRVEEDNDGWSTGGFVSLSDVAEEDETERDPELEDAPNGIRDSVPQDTPEKDGPCARLLEGHTKAVTALYFEDECLVTGASDKTLRQWDLTTGQCVMTMDILWAISHPPKSGAAAGAYGAPSATGGFAVPTPPYADGSCGLYEDFVGGVQFWGYGLVSGSGDGAVRMWDTPVSCLQFDEIHIASGSLDKTIRVGPQSCHLLRVLLTEDKIWDLRTGGIFETINYDHAVTGLQFDTRKIIAATGENGVK
ncbi:hypothetical protein C0991_003728, partial [Blastosporella zonata]